MCQLERLTDEVPQWLICRLSDGVGGVVIRVCLPLMPLERPGYYLPSRGDPVMVRAWPLLTGGGDGAVTGALAAVLSSVSCPPVMQLISDRGWGRKEMGPLAVSCTAQAAGRSLTCSHVPS